MSGGSTFLKELQKRGVNAPESTAVSAGGAGGGFLKELNKLKKKEKEIDRASLSNDIAPVKEEKEEEGLDFFDAGSFSDGYQMWDVSKAILGTVGDVGHGILKGGVGMVEGLTDLATYGAAGISGLFGADELSEKLKHAAKADFTGDTFKRGEEFLDKYSLLGDTSNAVAQGVGQVGTIILTGGAAGAAGLSSAGVSAVTTAAMGLSGMGSGMGEAYKNNATDGEAVAYGAMAGAADAVTELIFGGLGKGINALGFSKGLSSADDILAKTLSSKIQSVLGKNLVEFGVKAGAEGLEEVLAGTAQAAAKQATYMSEKDFADIIKDENLLEQFVVGALTSGIAQGGDVYKATKAGKDLVTGFTKNEQAVVKKEIEKRIAEREKGGKKLTAKEKSTIEAQVEEDMEKGNISIDTIEEVLGGDSFKTYKETIDNETSLKEQQKALQTEYDELYKMEIGKKSDEQVDRQAQLKSEIEEIQAKLDDTERISQRDMLKAQLDKDVFEISKSDRLKESFFEKVRENQKYETDLNKYTGKAREVIQQVMDSGLADNTNKTHEFWDLVAGLAERSDTNISLASNEQILEMVKAEHEAKGIAFDASKFEGQLIDGYASDNGIVMNAETKRALNFVVGHEITHTLEKSKHYGTLQKLLFEYAKGEYDSRFNVRKGQYSNKFEADEKFKSKIDREVTADLVGDYIFNDKDFIAHLAKDRNVFQKVFDEIKYMAKIATAGSEQARELERVKREFERAWRESNKVQKNTAENSGVNYSLSRTKSMSWSDQINGALYDGKNIRRSDTLMVANSADTAVSNEIDNKPLAIPQSVLTKASSGKDISHSIKRGKLAKLDEGIKNAPITIVNPDRNAVVYVTNIKQGGLPILAAFDMNATFDGDEVHQATSIHLQVDTQAMLESLPESATVYVQKNELDPVGATNNLRGLAAKIKFIDGNISQDSSEVKGQFSLSDSDGKQLTKEQSVSEFINETEKGLDARQEVSFSLSNDTVYMDKAIARNNSSLTVDSKVMAEAKAVRGRIADRMNAIKDRGLVGLPEDIEGNTYIANSSYDGTEENTTICPRSLASEAFTDAVSEYLGRPLTVEEQIYISQDLQGRSLTPECTYCYVATDRKAYRAFLGEYIKQRDSVLQKLKSNPNADVSKDGALYNEFLSGRKPTDPMYKRFKMWVNAYKNGTPMVDASHLANISKLMGDINSEFGEALKPQIVDAMKYAQSASWAKKRVNYVAYNGHILNWKQDRINKLNSHYGLRMYSFSDFHPAFVLENMQMITDASVRGLKMLGYTKDTDFVEIFAPSGMNINVSTFGFESGGNIYENNIIGAEWEKAKALREQYPNVGVTFVATNDTLVEWALEQNWIDVVIPYHLVRTGAEVAKAFNYTNYTSESSDAKDAGWMKGTDKKYIAPTEHNNDKATYLAALEKNHLKPRFERFIDNANYMKLVNECRQAASESKPVQPVFNEDAAMKALAKLEANGYYQPIGGSVERMYEIAAEVAEDMGQALAPAMSISNSGQQHKDAGGYQYYSHIPGSDIAPGSQTKNAVETPETEQNVPIVDDVAPVTSVTEENTVTEDIAPVAKGYETIRRKQDKKSETVRETPAEQASAEVLTEEPSVNKSKQSAWSKIKNLVLDKGMIFEDLSLATGNRELQARWNSIRYADGKAQRLIGNGNAYTKSLKSIQEQVENSGKTKQFYEYLYHLHNVDRMSLEGRYRDMPNKAVFGDSVTADMSRMMATELAKENPEFRSWSQDVYRFNNYLRKLLVEGGVISQETADLWAEMYPHYVPIRRAGDDGLNINVPLDTGKTGVNAPIKRATGGNRDILPLFDTMAQRTLQTYKAIAKNRFGVELKNTLGTAFANEAASIDDIIDSVDQQEGLLQEGKNGKAPTFTVFENGEKVTFEITEEMYDAIKPASDIFSGTNKALNAVSNFRRGLLTEYNPTFMLTNAIKDAQDVLFNSQHATKTYAAFPKAIKELATRGKWYTEYVENGGEQNTYFDNETNAFEKEKRGFVKAVGVPFEAISTANNFIERVPRLAEYIASREAGRSIDVSMLDSARVTTNFAAGGDFTKWMNRNGATFLNASVQGFMQNVRNVREAKVNGLKGVGVLAAKIAAAGLSGLLLNHLLWGDDEEYEELSDYVKQNYYIVGKYGDGQFVRIPKGRMMAVVQNAFVQMQNAVTGDDEVDLQTFGELFISNLAPNNPLDNNIISPIIQAATNTTWYGDELVPTSLQDQPAGEQYDETTDSISKWLGEKLDVSPYKINYLLDQYSGGIGDTFLPMLTPAAERGDDSLAGNIIAPLKDKFTTDSVLKNQNVSDFYGLKEELTVNANASDATDDDVLKSKYVNSVNSELNELYAQKREIQNSNKPDAEKYKLVRNIQSRIVELTREALNTYEDVRYENDGEYAVIGDKYFQWYTPEEGDPYWRKLTASQTTKYLVTSAAGDANYATDGNVHYRRNEDGEWTKISDKQLERQNEVTKALGITPEEYWSETDGEYEYAYDNPENYAVAKAVGGYDSYKQYSGELYNIKADKDANGKSINGSRREKVVEYINNLDADYGTKIILFKSEYPSDDTYNSEIVEYLNGRDDISYEEMETILKKLGFTVSSDGTVTWD